MNSRYLAICGSDLLCPTTRVNCHVPIADPVLAEFFICNALVAEFIGVKIFAVEGTLGLGPYNWVLFGRQGSLNFTAGCCCGRLFSS
jgi:hypothetical protein